jgi:hypothetical protein
VAACAAAVVCLFYVYRRRSGTNTPPHLDALRAMQPKPVLIAEQQSVGGSCPLSRPPAMPRRHGVWNMMLDRQSACEVAVYGAYYDDRNNERVVRVLGVTNCDSSETLTCQLWFGSEVMTSSPRVENTGRGLSHEGTHYQERLYTCPLPGSTRVPDGLALTHVACDRASTIVNVTVPSREKIHDFGVCVVVAYGTIIPARLVEWVEWQLLLGAGEINVYNSNTHSATTQVFDYYARREVMWVGRSAPPLNDWCLWCQKLAAIAVLNDCLYRNMYRYDHTIVVDFDEVIVPRLDDNYSALLKRLSVDDNNVVSPAASYEFRNAYFFFEFGPFSNQVNLFSARYLNRLHASPVGYSPKSMVNPRWCVVMQNHYCMIQLPGFKGKFTHHVHESVALSHHYKFCISSWSETECTTEMKKEFVRDTTAQRFQRELFHRTAAAYFALFQTRIPEKN